MEYKDFDVPVVLFSFIRSTGFHEIMPVLQKVKPKKLYILSDNGRNENEKKLVKEVRETIESYIDWDCEVIKRYSKDNLGVIDNIGGGAKWVLSQEKNAIFLEDDNLPEITFFKYCQELLEKYKNTKEVLWICGTNYETESNYGNDDYYFTQHLLPCGWASWSDKFNDFYDINLEKLGNPGIKEKIRKTYEDKQLFKQQYLLFEKTKYLLNTNRKKSSWDYQMLFSLRANGMYGIAPKFNQIKNIGVDELSTHGGVSFDSEMTRRFCGIPTKKIQFPLQIEENKIKKNLEFEKFTGNTIKYPLKERLMIEFATIVKPLLGIDKHASFVEFRKNKKRDNK